jgi:hypothetical protein
MDMVGHDHVTADGDVVLLHAGASVRAECRMELVVRENSASVHSAERHKIERIVVALENLLQTGWPPIYAPHRAGVVAAVPGGKV